MQAFVASLNQRLLVVTIVLELFSGSGRFGRAAAAAGEWVLTIDIRFGDHHDLNRRSLQMKILGWIQAGQIRYVLAGFPCQSFSRARNMPGGPPALRNSDNVRGFPGLRDADQRKVTLGNNLLYFTIRVMCACLAVRVPAIAENPWTSWAWKMACVLALRRNPYVRFTRSDFCCWGTPWQKGTGFLTIFCETQLFGYRCTGRHRCSITHKPHVQLKGTNSVGIFLTAIAEPYPKPLCRALVKTCQNAYLRLKAEGLDQFFCHTCA